MADYFTHFSRALDLGSADAVARALTLLDDLRDSSADDDEALYGFEATPDLDHPGKLYFTDDGGQGDPEHLIRFVLACAEAFDLNGRWGFTWALTCSRHRLDGFGGGAQVLDLGARKSTGWVDCGHWLAMMLDPTAKPGDGAS